MVFVLCFALEARAHQKVRMLLLLIGGLIGLTVMLAGLLSIPSVNELFQQRASLTQNYDTGETGRFGRQAYAIKLALENPLGLGPLQFRNLRIVEEPHNTYINVLHAYGWGGGLAFLALIFMTMWRGVKALGMASPNRLLMIPLIAAYIPLSIQAALIDVDHWRHYFLVMGLIWGVSASYGKLTTRQKANRQASIV
jgi:O-antigen ligase